MSLILNWLLQESWYVLHWWLLITLAGIAVIPLIWSWLKNFSDRGVLLARTLGVVLIVGLFWLLVCFGFLKNEAGSIALCWLLVFVSCLIYFNTNHQLQKSEWITWWHQNKFIFICGEIVFLVLLFGWALFRARIQDFASTEKPMELMLLSAINNSVHFPPNDAWLSGYSISYYYFGFLISSSLAKLSGVSNAIAFDLTSAAWLGLSGITIYGTCYNLIRWQKNNSESLGSSNSNSYTYILGALLAVYFALLLSNGHYLLIELPFQRGLASPGYLQFMDAKDRCEGSGTRYWWWFAAARTIVDRTPDYEKDCNPDTHIEVIDEFPAFSFLLGDNHPHIYGIPIAVLMMSLAWHRYTNKSPPSNQDNLIYGVCLGAQLCTNAWDAPIYLILLISAETLRNWRIASHSLLTAKNVKQIVKFSIKLFVIMLLFASPLLLNIRSQASGLLPNLENPTRFQQLWVMFTPFFILFSILFFYLFFYSLRYSLIQIRGWRFATFMTACIVLLLFFLSVMLGIAYRNDKLQIILNSFVDRRIQLEYALSIVYLTIGILFLFLYLYLFRTLYPNHIFTLSLVIAGFTLILIPEFVFVRDLFGTRMNTIFKFYFQAWLLFSVAAAYGSYHMLFNYSKHMLVVGSSIFFVLLILLIGSIYLPTGILSRIREAQSTNITLGNIRTSVTESDLQLGSCLSDHFVDREIVLVEGIPGLGERRSYNINYGRIATITGIPTVIAWEPHQHQWRGDSYFLTGGNRTDDIDSLYSSENWQETRELIQRYQIDVIIWGSQEQFTYGASAEVKFAENLTAFCLQEHEDGRSLAYFTHTVLTD